MMNRTQVGKQSAKGSHSSSLASINGFLEFIPLDVNVEEARQIIIKGKDLTTIPPNIGALLQHVRRIDLSANNITDVTPLSTLPHLTSLNLSKNAHLVSIAALASLKLTVCVLAHCGLHSLRGLSGSAASLKSLIVNDNHLMLQSPSGPILPEAKPDAVSLAVENYETLAALEVCETLVLSRNARLCSLHVAPTVGTGVVEHKEDTKKPSRNLTEVPQHEADWTHPLSFLARLPQLRKVSLSGCGLTSLPAHLFLEKVTELRLSHNALTTLVPEGVIFRSVKILDVSNNALTSPATLRRCRFVRLLSISGNPFQSESSDETTGTEMAKPLQKLTDRLVHFLTRMMPHLEAVDGVSLSSWKQKESGKADHHGAPETTTETIKHTDEWTTEEEKCNKEDKDLCVRESMEVLDPSLSTSRTHGQRQTALQAKGEVEDEKDVVVEPPSALTEVAHAPIVRRERTNLLDQRRKRLAADGADVAKLLTKRRTETTGW